MNFSRLLRGGGGSCELDPVLFLFTGTALLGAIENEGEWFGNTEFLEGREGLNGV